jgi:radical SAM superfamily enzyme YgiQ (UPF0313 family)
MKILFSNPPWWAEDAGVLRMGIRAGSRWPFTRNAAHMPDEFKFGAYLPAPFFLQYAASYTQRALPHSFVALRDSVARGESYDAYLHDLRHNTPDWLIIETATPSWSHDALVLEALRRQSPEMKVILCGTLDAANAPKILGAHKNVVAIVQGEPDKQIAKVIRGEASGLVPHDLLTVDEMNGAPLPAWDDECAQHYWDGCPVGHHPPQLQIWTSRGCPFRCCFCVWPATMTGHDPDGTGPRSVRCYSAEYVERLIAERTAAGIVAGTPYRSLYLDDDTFNLTDRHTVAMCEVMRKTGLPWSAMCRADTISAEAWQLMRDCGCFGVKIGFESGNQYVLDHIVNKRLDLRKAEATAKWLRTIGISVHGTFTIGLPGETQAQQQQTRDFIARLYDEGGLDTHQLSGAAEIEGTPMHTLRTRGPLAKYSGAVVDHNYTPSSDGQKKIEGMK